tara:strand:+ start:702 stop:920 length:219 start_codon:yes stop_codon:yes gene_type:complete
MIDITQRRGVIMKVGDIVKNRKGMNGIVIVMPPHYEPHGAILVHWFNFPVREWCPKGSIEVVSRHGAYNESR